MKSLTLILAALPGILTAAMQPVTLPDGAAQRLGLRIEALEVTAVSNPVRATGRLILDPQATVIVASPVGGRIEQDAPGPGTAVMSGESLLTLRSAERAASVTSYIDSEQQYRFAKAAYQREQKLDERKLTTTDALRERKLEVDRTRTAHLAAIQQIYIYGIPEMELHDMIDSELVRDDLSEHTITAPIDGVIIDKMTTRGGPVAANTPLLQIAALDHLMVKFQVPLRGVDRVREGAPVNFRAIVGDAGSGTAEVTALVPAADRATLSATAMARLQNTDGRWIAGTPVELLLEDPDAPRMPSVPFGSVVKIDGRPCVFVAEGPSVFRPQAVEVVAESSERQGIRGITGEGVQVVTAGATLLKAAWEEAQAAD